MNLIKNAPVLRYVNAEDSPDFYSLYDYLSDVKKELRGYFEVSQNSNVPCLNNPIVEPRVCHLLKLSTKEDLPNLIARIEAGIGNPPRKKAIDLDNEYLNTYLVPLLRYDEIMSVNDTSNWGILTNFWKNFYVILGFNPETQAKTEINERIEAFDRIMNDRWNQFTNSKEESLYVISQILIYADDKNKLKEMLKERRFNPSIEEKIAYESGMAKYVTQFLQRTHDFEWKQTPSSTLLIVPNQ